MRDVLEELLGPETEDEQEEQEELAEWPFGAAVSGKTRRQEPQDSPGIPTAEDGQTGPAALRPAETDGQSEREARLAFPDEKWERTGVTMPLSGGQRAAALVQRAEERGTETAQARLAETAEAARAGAETESLTADALRYQLWLGERGGTPGRAGTTGPAENARGQARTAEWFYQRLRRTQQAAEYRRPVPSGAVSLAKWSGTAQAAPVAEVGRLDRLFRRDARRYDGGFTWL